MQICDQWAFVKRPSSGRLKRIAITVYFFFPISIRLHCIESHCILLLYFKRSFCRRGRREERSGREFVCLIQSLKIDRSFRTKSCWRVSGANISDVEVNRIADVLSLFFNNVVHNYCQISNLFPY